MGGRFCAGDREGWTGISIDTKKDLDTFQGVESTTLAQVVGVLVFLVTLLLAHQLLRFLPKDLAAVLGDGGGVGENDSGGGGPPRRCFLDICCIPQETGEAHTLALGQGNQQEQGKLLRKLEALLDVLSAEGLRMVPTHQLLAVCAALFGGAAGTQWEDPETRRRAFGLSQPADRIDAFVSHSWRASRWIKYFALLLHLNATPAFRLALGTGLFLTAAQVYLGDAGPFPG